MAQSQSAFSRDANGVPITNTFDSLIATVSRVYTGAAGLGAQGATTLFTVTGVVAVRCIGICTEDLASTSGTIEIGVAGNTASIIAQTTASAIDNTEVWMDATPAIGDQLTATPRVMNNSNIIETIATADITDGQLTIYALWMPISSDGNLVAA